jgi:hypothetical protein
MSADFGDVPDGPADPWDPSDAFLNAYIGSTRQAAEQSLKSLDASINWALTSTLGVLAFVINAFVIKGSAEPDDRGFLMAILGTSLAMLVHFAIRASKNYLNIVRFAKLERETLKCTLRFKGATSDHLRKIVFKYHVNWASPLGIGTITRKVLFEFGFMYMLAFVSFMFWFVAQGSSPDKHWVWIVVALVTTIAVLVEVLIFSHSPYIKHIELDGDVQAKA